MKILYVLDEYGLFGRPNNGASHRNTLYVKALATIGHVDVCSFSKETIVSDIEDCDVIYSNPNIEEGNLYVRNVKCLIQMTFKPSNPNSYFKKNVKREQIVDEFVKNNGYGLIACRYISTAIKCGLLKYRDKLVIDIDDNPSNSLKSIAGSSDSFLLRVRNLYMARTIQIMVKQLLENVFCSFYSNILEPPSSESIYLHNSVASATVIPNICSDKTNRILFVGILSYPPNKYGITHFVNNIYPLIRQRVPDVELHIIGKGDQSMLIELNNIGGGIKAPGFVDDIVSEYEAAKVVVIPIYHGSGTCIKFVEGMFMNRPVVSTSVGARGFDRIAEDNVHYCLAKDDEEFVNKTVDLLQNTQKANEMANKAYELAKNNYSQEKFIEIVKETIETKLKQKQTKV